MKIFSHRGLSDSKTRENSLDAFKKAFEKGIRALEVDIWCLENELFLTHDHTYKPENLNKLEELFSEFGNDVFYWLDFKNLSPKNTLDVMKKVKKITKDLKIDLKQIYFAPYIENFNAAQEIYLIIKEALGKKVKILSVLRFLNYCDYQSYYQKFTQAGLFGISIEYQNINLEFKNIFHDVPIFAWTVNDVQIAKSLKNLGIENVTSDYLEKI